MMMVQRLPSPCVPSRDGHSMKFKISLQNLLGIALQKRVGHYFTISFPHINFVDIW